MKKILTGIVTTALAVLLCMVMAGCATNVSGKTYEYDSYKIEYDDSVTDDAKQAYEATLGTLEAAWKLVTYSFDEDGYYSVSGIKTGTYEQDGSTVTTKALITGVKTGEFTASGKKLKSVTTAGGITTTVIYKQK